MRNILQKNAVYAQRISSDIRFTNPSFFHPSSHPSLYTNNHNPIAEVVIVVDVDQRRFSSTAEGKVNSPVICILLLVICCPLVLVFAIFSFL